MRVPLRPYLPLLASLLVGCSGEPDLVVYVSLDQVFSERMIAEFERETGLEVDAEYDTEASKTVGLVRRIGEERENPRCDVYWNNEIAQTVRLARHGLLAPYDSPSAADIPEHYRDTDRRWTGFAARARILIVNTTLANPAEITGTWDLLDPKWKGKAAIARPLTGTTLTHATALYDILGEEEAQRYLDEIIAANRAGDLHIANSNGQVATLVANGECAFGWTDTDDYNVQRMKGAPVVAVYPDQHEGGDGTMLIPNTVAIIKGARHREAAERFVDWVLSKEVEAELAASDSAQIPVRADVPRPDHVKSVESFRVMPVSYVSVGKQIEKRALDFQKMFLGGGEAGGH